MAELLVAVPSVADWLVGARLGVELMVLARQVAELPVAVPSVAEWPVGESLGVELDRKSVV